MNVVGVIPAAGISSRLFPHTKSISKLMMPVAGKPVVDYLVQEFIDAGVKDIYITGRNLDDVKNYFLENDTLIEESEKFGHPGSIERLNMASKNVNINFLTQNTPSGWLAEIKRVNNKVKTDYIVVAFSDIIYSYDESPIKQLLEQSQMGKKTVNCNGRYVFTSDACSLLTKFDIKTNGNNIENEIHFLALLSKQLGIEHPHVEGISYDVGDWLSWLKTNTQMALLSKEFGDDYRQFLLETIN